MKGVYILTALVGLGFAAWIGFLVVNGTRMFIERRRRSIESSRKDRRHTGMHDPADGGPERL